MTQPGTKQSTRAASITGRDAYIMAQALYQACKWQERLGTLSIKEYEWSNHQDMKAILMEAYPHWAGVLVMQDLSAGRTPANLENEKEDEPIS